jgi:hypothetical protein
MNSIEDINDFGIGIKPPIINQSIELTHYIGNPWKRTYEDTPVNSDSTLMSVNKDVEWITGNILTVVAVKVFHDSGWKVIGKDSFGNMSWLMPWQIKVIER